MTDPQRAEQSQSENTPPPLTEEYLDVTGGWAREQCVEAQCSSCSNPAVPGATRCQHCIDHHPPQNYQQVKERYPQLPVQRLGEARRFA